MKSPTQSLALQTVLAVAIALTLLTAIASSIVYAYNLGLLQLMLFWFPRFDGIGLIGIVLAPILVAFMLLGRRSAWRRLAPCSST